MLSALENKMLFGKQLLACYRGLEEMENLLMLIPR